jgi:hypothetical protein
MLSKYSFALLVIGDACSLERTESYSKNAANCLDDCLFGVKLLLLAAGPLCPTVIYLKRLD